MTVFRLVVPSSRLLLIAALLVNAGCAQLSYYRQAVVGQLGVLAAARPVEELLDDPVVAPGVRQRLGRLPAWLAFAEGELGLKTGNSYRSYVDVGPKAMVWSLVATPADSLRPRQWCYPVVGCASYRGYFREETARRHAGELAAAGWDVAVEPVPAYSTLGWFSDPLPSTVMDWPLEDIAGLVFHELAHETLYLPGDSAFNEGYATLVEAEGVVRWLIHSEDRLALDDWRQRQRRKRAFNALLGRARGWLETLYAQAEGAAATGAAKQAVFARLRAAYRGLKQSWGGYRGYDRWFDRPLNNAHLASVATYQSLLPAFTQLLKRHDGDMRAFHRACRELARKDAAERQAVMAGLMAAASGAALPDQEFNGR